MSAAWATKIIRESQAEMLAASPSPAMMPVKIRHELGCGSYGCVYATSDPSVVFKITSDPEEAAFVKALLETKRQYPGVIHYMRIIPLWYERKHRPVFALWREAAFQFGPYVGKILPTPSTVEFEKRLSAWNAWAGTVRRLLDAAKDPAALWKAAKAHYNYVTDIYDSRLTSIIPRAGAPVKDQLAWAALIVQHVGDELEQGRYGSDVGKALRNWLRNGVLLADVHLGNIGWVMREGREMLVITDPGHALLLPS